MSRREFGRAKRDMVVGAIQESPANLDMRSGAYL